MVKCTELLISSDFQVGVIQEMLTKDLRTEVTCIFLKHRWSIFLSILLFSGLMIHRKSKPYVWHYIHFCGNWFKIVFIEGHLEVYSISHWRQRKNLFLCQEDNQKTVLKHRGAYLKGVKSFMAWNACSSLCLLFSCVSKVNCLNYEKKLAVIKHDVINYCFASDVKLIN